MSGICNSLCLHKEKTIASGKRSSKARAASVPKITHRRCSKCNTTHTAPTGSKCMLLPDITVVPFPDLSANSESGGSGNKTSKPKSRKTGTNNQILIRTACGSMVMCTSPIEEAVPVIGSTAGAVTKLCK